MNNIKKVEENQENINNISAFDISIVLKISTKTQNIWFSLLFHALPDMKTQNKFLIPANQLKQEIKYSSKNNQGIKKLLSELKSVIIEWKIKSRYGETWELNSLLADCRIKTGTDAIEYSFSPFLQEKLTTSELFPKINLLLTRKFKSKNSLAIYCLALDNFFPRTNFGIKNFTLQEFRDYLRLEEYEYFKPGELLKHVVKKAEEDINTNSDLNIRLIPIRTETTKITGFQLEVSIKPECVNRYKLPKPVIKEKPADQDKSKSKKKVEQIIIKNRDLKQFLAENNIMVNTLTLQERLSQISEKIGKDRVDEYLLHLKEYAEREHQKGEIKKMAGFFVNLIKDDVQFQSYQLGKEKINQSQEDKHRKLSEKMEKRLTEKYNGFITEDFREYLLRNLDSLEIKIIEVIGKLPEKSFAREMIDRHNKGKIDSSLLTTGKTAVKYPVLNYLRDYTTELGYKIISFNIWKQRYVTDAVMEEIKQEILKE